jgi:hypothetical protein
MDCGGLWGRTSAAQVFSGHQSLRHASVASTQNDPCAGLSRAMRGFIGSHPRAVKEADVSIRPESDSGSGLARSRSWNGPRTKNGDGDGGASPNGWDARTRHVQTGHAPPRVRGSLRGPRRRRSWSAEPHVFASLQSHGMPEQTNEPPSTALILQEVKRERFCRRLRNLFCARWFAPCIGFHRPLGGKPCTASFILLD